MNLAINTLSARHGGGQSYLINLLKHAGDHCGMKITIFTQPEFAGLYDFPGVKVIQCAVSSKNVLQRFIWERTILPKLLRKLHIDLVFCPGGTINFSPPKKCLTAVMFQNMLIFDSERRREYPLGFRRLRLAILERMSRKSFAKADVVIFISEFARSIIDSKLPDRSGSSVVIPHGLDESFRTGAIEDIPRSRLIPDGDYLLYVSYIHKIKSQLEIIKAYHILCQKRDTNEKLLLVGSETSSYGKLVREEIQRLGLQDRVIVTGNIPYDDMPSVYHYAKAHIYASSCENCPNIVLESLASGKPLFLSSKQPMPELAEDGAVYFDPFNPDELAALLLKYLDDDRWMKDIGEKAYERSLFFNWEQTSKKTFNEMREVCA